MKEGKQQPEKFILLVVLLVVTGIFISIGNRPPSIRKSTVLRTPLATSAPYEPIYSAQYDRVPTTLLSGMQDFYDATGISVAFYEIPNLGSRLDSYANPVYTYNPFLEGYGGYASQRDLWDALAAKPFYYNISKKYYAVEALPDDVQAEAFAQELYNRQFTDGAHMVVLYYYEYKTQYYDGRYNYGSGIKGTNVWYYCGDKAAEIMDRQAGKIFLDCIKYYAYESDGPVNCEVLGRAFSETALRIMGPPQPGALPVILAAGVLCGLVVVVILFLRGSKDKKQWAKVPILLVPHRWLEKIDLDQSRNDWWMKILPGALQGALLDEHEQEDVLAHSTKAEEMAAGAAAIEAAEIGQVDAAVLHTPALATPSLLPQPDAEQTMAPEREQAEVPAQTGMGIPTSKPFDWDTGLGDDFWKSGRSGFDVDKKADKKPDKP